MEWKSGMSPILSLLGRCYNWPNDLGLMGLQLKMADVLDASINLNCVTGVKRQCAVEKRALEIYNDSLDRVCKMAGDLMKATRMEELLSVNGLNYRVMP